jgi:hypothetical protein
MALKNLRVVFNHSFTVHVAVKLLVENKRIALGKSILLRREREGPFSFDVE